MIKLSVLYPNVPGGRFDLDYYRRHHLALLKARLGDACKGYVVCAGVSGLERDSAAPYVATCELLFDSREAFEQAFLPHGPAFRADHPNYTDIAPVRMVSEVVG
ncbi:MULTISPECIES: EthD family reductase [Ramlibacter]|jgi:uncharacterized protein (TIGR02118 family)|uniref:EthD family reductase n=1 Tax=Ramlibacter pinisoli TaxID=2682844 RepID=A0A6N8J112_9BURK|nr:MULTISPECIES: EthD family reductase [Ramlibacter]MBA2962010.1 EthD family reductase [Ramlibacter sp. CGMCC 1.13660]MVQ31953.1 EthD family reductase [Ramlibacter pinisoli]